MNITWGKDIERIIMEMKKCREECIHSKIYVVAHGLVWLNVPLLRHHSSRGIVDRPVMHAVGNFLSSSFILK